MSAVGKRPAVPVRAEQVGLFGSAVQVRFSHCDPAGIVYTPRWFDLLNGVVEDWFNQALGLDYRGFHQSRGISLGYAHAQADFLSPGYWNDSIDIFVRVGRVGNAALHLHLSGFRGDTSVLAAHLVLVTTALAERRAIPLPDDLRRAVERYRDAEVQRTYSGADL